MEINPIGLIRSKIKYSKRVLVGIPTTGTVRMEWVLARYGQTIPANWSQVDMIQWLNPFSPIDFLVAEARNVICDLAIKQNFEWIFFIDHDTILPPGTLIKMNDYMMENRFPVVSGLYFTRSVPSEPLIYRGRGNSYFSNWYFGDKVFVDGLPMGCTLINVNIIRELAKISDEYVVNGQKIKRIFITPGFEYFDPEVNEWMKGIGTEDLEWCDRIIENKIIQKLGYEVSDQDNPFLIDTSISCTHIDQNGIQYPSQGEHLKFILPSEQRI